MIAKRRGSDTLVITTNKYLFFNDAYYEKQLSFCFRENVQNNRQLLLKSLSDVKDDPAEVLLVFTVYPNSFSQTVSQNMIKVSGKFVSSVLGFLQKYLNENNLILLQNYHGKY